VKFLVDHQLPPLLRTFEAFLPQILEQLAEGSRIIEIR
jgi:hypothetical protein